MLQLHPNRRALLLLALASVAGVLLGGVSALRESPALSRVVPANAIALVNEKTIRTEEYQRAVSMLASDKRTVLTDADRVYVLNRLIEEELLVQHAIASGLVDTDRTVRKAMSQAMLASIVTESASTPPTQEELRVFYEEHAALFKQNVLQGTAEPPVGQLPAFEEVRAQLEEWYVQQAQDTALRDYLAWLRQEAQLVLRP